MSTDPGRPPGASGGSARRGLPVQPLGGLQPAGGLQAVGSREVRWERVPVRGGDLALAVWGETAAAGEVVVGVHDLPGNALAWAGVAGLLDGEPPLAAPDLRGRGGSAGLPGPHGLAQHADDLLRVLDALACDRALLAGHGWGAGVARFVAGRHPDRVAALVLVDPEVVSPPPGVPAQGAGTREAHRAAWRGVAGLDGPWNRLVEAMVAHDAEGEEPAVRTRLAPQALRQDAAEGVGGAEEGGAEEGGATGDDVASSAATGDACPPVPVTLVLPADGPGVGGAQGGAARVVPATGCSHWSLLLGLRGADAVARALRPA